MKNVNLNCSLFSLGRDVGRLALKCALLLFVVAACKPAPSNKNCFEEFEVSVAVKKITHSYIDIPIESLKFLFAQDNFVLDDVQLDVVLKGHHHETEEVSLSLNGIKVSRHDGHNNHMDRYENDDKNGRCNSHYKLHKLYLNGAEPFDSYLIRLKENKGVLRIKLHKIIHDRRHDDDDDFDGKIESAKVVFRGRTFSDKCQTNPPPPPPPIDPTAYAPHIDSTDPATSPTALTTMTIAFSAASSGGTFSCSLDGSAATLCQSPVNYSGLTNGSHNFQVSATAPNGQSAGAAANYTWVIDTVPPSVTITNAGTLPTLTNLTSLSFSFVSSEPGTFKCSLDGAAVVACSSPQSYSSLAEGSHVFSVHSVDNLGNVSTNPAVFQWSVDLTSPLTTIIDVSPTEAISHVDSRAFTFISNEAANFSCSIDNGAFVTCSSPLSINHLSEDSHWFEVLATDLAGNVGLSVSYSWRTDYMSPTLTLGAVQPDTGLTNARNVSAEFSSDEPATFHCSWDNSPEAECLSPFTQPIHTEGPHQLAVYAEDLAGNQSSTTLLNWTMDFTAPILSFGEILPSASSSISSSDLSAVIVGSESMNLSVTLNGSVIAALNPVVLSSLPEGDYSLSISGVDSAGNASNTITHSFTVDLTAPTLSLQSDGVSPTNLDLRKFTFSASEDSQFDCDLDGAGFSQCSSPLVISGIADGEHTFTVRATDLAGNSTQANSLWVVDTTAPITYINASPINTSILFTLSSNEVDAVFFCSLDGSAFVSCAATVNYSGLLTGDHTFIAKAKDAAGNMDSLGATYLHTVLPPIQTSITSAQPFTSPTNSTTMSVTFEASQPASGFLCSLDGAVEVSCTSPASFANLSDGTHSLTVKAIDTFGVADATGASHSWLVDITPPSTLISANQSGKNISFSLSSNELNSTFFCSMDGSAFTLCSSSLSYTNLPPGSHTFIAKAQDGVGNLDPVGASHSFSVAPPIQTLIVAINPSAALTNATFMTITFSANQQASGFKCSLDGSTFSSCTSPISYTELADANHSFTVKATDQFGDEDPSGASYSWTVDTIPPVPSFLSLTINTNVIIVVWTTNEPSTSQVMYGVGGSAGINQSTTENMTLTTNHSVTLTGLSSNTLYSLKAVGHDGAGNLYIGAPTSARTHR